MIITEFLFNLRLSKLYC